MSTAHPRGLYLAQDPAGWTYGGTRTELDARIRIYQSQHPDITSRAEAEHAIRTADRHRAKQFLYRIKRGELAELLGGPQRHEPTPALDAIPLCGVCGARALQAIHEAARGTCDWCEPTTNGHQPHPGTDTSSPNGDRSTA
jgi:hypothetical protein